MEDEKKRKRIATILILIPIAVIATCNIVLNTKSENEDKAVVNAPAPGDYFIFHRDSSYLDLPFKIKEISSDDITFYVPQYEVGSISNDRMKLKSKIDRLEAEKKLYGVTTISISKGMLDSMTNLSIEKRKYDITDGLRLSFVDSYKGYHK